MKKQGFCLKQDFHFCAIFVLLLLSQWGCEEETLPPLDDLTSGYHFFGLKAEPPQVKPNGKVKITAFDYHPSKQKAISYQWRVCFMAQSTQYQDVAAELQCIDPELDFRLTDFEHQIEIDLSSNGFNFESLFQAHAIRYPDSTGTIPSLKNGVDIWVILKSGVPGEGSSMISTKKIRVSSDEESLRRNPRIVNWTLSEDGLRNASRDCVQERESFEQNIIDQVMIDSDLTPTINTSATSTDPNECVVHSLGTLAVDLDVKPAKPEDALVYGFYSNLPVGFNTVLQDQDQPSSTINMGIFTGKSRELFLVVRDEHGGFDLVKQKLNVITGLPK